MLHCASSLCRKNSWQLYIFSEQATSANFSKQYLTNSPFENVFPRLARKLAWNCTGVGSEWNESRFLCKIHRLLLLRSWSWRCFGVLSCYLEDRVLYKIPCFKEFIRSVRSWPTTPSNLRTCFVLYIIYLVDSDGFLANQALNRVKVLHDETILCVHELLKEEFSEILCFLFSDFPADAAIILKQK